MEGVMEQTWGPDDPFWRLVLRDCAEADVLLVNSDFVRETFVDAGYPATKIRVVYLGVRDDFIAIGNRSPARGGSAVERAQEAVGANGGEEIRLLFTGRFGERKGCDVLLAAMRFLKERNVAVTLTVVGDCDRVYAPRLAEAAGRGDVHYHAFVPQRELKAFLAESDLYVFPSRAEGCACSGMEAMAAGLCVVATRESGLPITHGVDGFIVPAGDAEALARQIAWLAAHPVERLEASVAAMKKVGETMTWERYAAGVGAVYEEIATHGLIRVD
jgi:glycosyltransferase involved in cell wall biosynthesis